MKILLFVCCLCSSMLPQASCLPSDDDFNNLKSEVREIASTLADFMEEMREQFRTMQNEVSEGTIEESDKPMQNDSTIEERLTELEFQVESLTVEVTDLTVEVTDQDDEIDVISGEVAVIFADQVIQDERILELEDESEGLEDSIVNLESTVSTIDNRLTVVNYTLSGETQELDSRVTLVENTVNELQDTVSQLDARVTQMEVTGTVAFQADFDSYSWIPIGSIVVFDIVALNIGNGYNSATGLFIVPSGEAGLYFFYVNFFVQDSEYGDFNIRVNGQAICAANADMNNIGVGDNGTASCAAVTTLAEGDVVDVYFHGGTDYTPVDNNTYKYNSFTGFRIAPE